MEDTQFGESGQGENRPLVKPVSGLPQPDRIKTSPKKMVVSMPGALDAFIE